MHEQLAKTPMEQRSPALVAALQYGATAFLALHNMLGLAHADDWFARIEQMTIPEFRAWIARVSASGAVTG